MAQRRDRLGFSIMLLLLAIPGVAAEDEVQRENATRTQPTAVATPASTATPTAASAKLPSQEEEIRATLEGTTWPLEVTPLLSGGKTKGYKDTVTFTARQVISEKLSKGGYPSSNYSLTIGDDGVPVWETMQTKEAAGVVFWRGELHGSAMRGVVSKHPTEGAAEDFSFVGQEAAGKAAGASAQKLGETHAAAPVSMKATSAQEERPKKPRRRGLFGR